MKVVVTGGSGKTGRWVVDALRNVGHDVLNVDWTHDGREQGSTVTVDLTDPGQTQELLTGAEMVVHLAAIPAPGIRSESETFRINTLSTYNVFSSAVATDATKVIWASSETVLGLPFDTPPQFAPIDETIEPRPESSYALSKLVGEEMAAQFTRRSGIPFVGLRFSNIMEPADYERFPSFWDDPRKRKWNLWGYVDVRDVVNAVTATMESDLTGAPVFIIAANDTVMRQPSAELLEQVYPDVPLRRPVEGRETLLAIDSAREVLGYEPRHTWMDHVS